MIHFYNQQVDGFKKLGKINPTNGDVDEFVDTDPRKISWSDNLKQNLKRGILHHFDENCLVQAMYRPFCKQWLYYNHAFNERVYQIPKLFPNSSVTNKAIVVTGIGANKEFSALMTSSLPDLEMISKGQCFPLYYFVEHENGDQSTNLFNWEEQTEKGNVRYSRRDAITEWALKEFQRNYGESVTKEDIFYYIYGILHSPEYRERFAANLKKMLPRIPLVSSNEDFWALSKAGRELAYWHLNYETVEPWPVQEIHHGDPNQNGFYRVEKMEFEKGKGKKVNKSTIIYNANITLTGIPLEAYEYVVNGKSAIEWIMERYRLTTDKASGITNDPNTWSDNPRYIVDLIKRIVRVSMETNRIVKGLPELSL